MKKRFLLFIIFIIFLVSLTTMILILNYVDPFEFELIWLSSLIFSYIMTISCFFTIFLYFLKKIYYRWNVFIYHVLASFRQWFLISIFTASLIYFYNIEASIIITWIILFIILFLLEIFIQSYEK